MRPIEPDEYARLGAITVDAYASLPGHVSEPDYDAELADVRTRAEAAATTVLVAVDDDGTVLGGVTLVSGPDSPYAEHSDPEAGGIRMLAVALDAQRRGVGEALVRACIDRAKAGERSEIVLHSTAWMQTAHRLYERLGFVRDESLDWVPVPRIELRGFRLTL